MLTNRSHCPSSRANVCIWIRIRIVWHTYCAKCALHEAWPASSLGRPKIHRDCFRCDIHTWENWIENVFFNILRSKLIGWQIFITRICYLMCIIKWICKRPFFYFILVFILYDSKLEQSYNYYKIINGRKGLEILKSYLLLLFKNVL